MSRASKRGTSSSSRSSSTASSPISSSPSASTVSSSNGDLQSMITHSSGAKRSKLMPRYDLIPQTALIRLAARFEMGLKYGEHNYKLGLPFDDTLNHIIDHLLSYKERRKEILRKMDRLCGEMGMGEKFKRENLARMMAEREVDGDDLAGAMWGIAAIMYLEKEGRLA